MSIRLQQYRFIDSKAGIITLATIHLLCGVLLLMSTESSVLLFERGQFCLLIAVIIAALYQHYDWRNINTNILLIGLYLVSIFWEWLAFGIPVSSVAYRNAGDYQYSKGFALPFFMKMLPWVYIGLRLTGTYFLYTITREAQKLKILAEPQKGSFRTNV